MAGTYDKKQRLIAEVTRVRSQMRDQLLFLRRKLNIGQEILESIRSHTWEWMSLAASFGWLLSRLPARKKKIYVYSSRPGPVKDSRNGPIGKLWKGAWAISKPLIATYIAKKLAQKANIWRSEVQIKSNTLGSQYRTGGPGH